MLKAILLVLVVGILACGCGGGMGDDHFDPRPPLEVTLPQDSWILSRAANASPSFGSVTQSSNVDDNGNTTDHVEASMSADGTVSFIVKGAGDEVRFSGSSVVDPMSSSPQEYPSSPVASFRLGHTAKRWWVDKVEEVVIGTIEVDGVEIPITSTTNLEMNLFADYWSPGGRDEAKALEDAAAAVAAEIQRLAEQDMSSEENTAEPDILPQLAGFGSWLVAGYWSYYDGTELEHGAFVDGEMFDSGAELSPNGMTVKHGTYQGIARGQYRFEQGMDDPRLQSGFTNNGEYQGQLLLHADFEAGRISGKISSINHRGFGHELHSYATVPYELLLEADIGKTFNGDALVISTDPSIIIASSSGSWGSDLSTGLLDRNERPYIIAGTHGAEFMTLGGTNGVYVGYHVGALPTGADGYYGQPVGGDLPE